MNEKGDLGFAEVAAKYPEVPGLVIRKIDVGLRGVTVSDRALQWARESNALFEEAVEVGGKKTTFWRLAEGAFRDGSSLFAFGDPLLRFWEPTTLRGGLVPYALDVIDGELALVDGEGPVEPVYLSTIPEYYGKTTSRGTPMHQILLAGPSDSLNLSPHNYCRFWDERQPCKYCTLGARHEGMSSGVFHSHRDANGGRKTEAELEDMCEAVSEALKESGRWTCIGLIAGSDPTGNTPYENEVDQYIPLLNTLVKCIGGRGPSLRVVASAFPEDQLVRLAEAGATSYTPSLEVWDERLFSWMCPGKAKHFGRQYWIDSAIAAVKVFGRGNVSIQWVGGAEMAQPYGFKTIDEAVASTLAGTEFFARHGVNASVSILRVKQGSIFYRQEQAQPSLEYCVKLSAGIRDIRRKYGVGVDAFDYRRCGINPDAELSRLDYPDVMT